MAKSCGTGVSKSGLFVEALATYPDEDDGHPAGTAVSRPVVLAGRDDAADDKVTDAHPNGTRDERLLAAPLVDVEHGRDGRKEHDNTDDAGREQRGGAAGQAERREDEGRIVEDD
jgi:hypothetical protein